VRFSSVFDICDVLSSTLCFFMCVVLTSLSSRLLLQRCICLFLCALSSHIATGNVENKFANAFPLHLIHSCYYVFLSSHLHHFTMRTCACILWSSAFFQLPMMLISYPPFYSLLSRPHSLPIFISYTSLSHLYKI
jgi:hypothetical protein